MCVCVFVNLWSHIPLMTSEAGWCNYCQSKGPNVCRVCSPVTVWLLKIHRDARPRVWTHIWLARGQRHRRWSQVQTVWDQSWSKGSWVANTRLLNILTKDINVCTLDWKVLLVQKQVHRSLDLKKHSESVDPHQAMIKRLLDPDNDLEHHQNAIVCHLSH